MKGDTTTKNAHSMPSVHVDEIAGAAGQATVVAERNNWDLWNAIAQDKVEYFEKKNC